MHYNYFRDYDPSIGRYVESDPIGLDGGFNTYDYVYVNPLNDIDPTGTLAPGAVGPLWIGKLGLAVHKGVVATLGYGAAIEGAGLAGYGAGTLINTLCNNCFGKLGISIYDFTHPRPNDPIYPYPYVPPGSVHKSMCQ